MARYADTLLSDGERIALRTRQHWFATIVDGRRAWGLLILSLILLFIATRTDGFLQTLFGYTGFAVLVASLLWVGKNLWEWQAQDYIVTNRRVLKVEGIINKRSADSSLEKINDAVLEQNLFGRMFGYGDLDILTAADEAVDKYRMLNAAPAFKKTMLDQKHELEDNAGRIPSPPLRATAPTPVVPAAPAVPVHTRMSAEDVGDTLQRLAALRDAGTITAAEYEAKKAELLDRI